MVSREASELVRHFSSDRHWERDVTYRVHKGMAIFNQLRQSIALTDEELNTAVVRSKRKLWGIFSLNIGCLNTVRSIPGCRC